MSILGRKPEQEPESEEAHAADRFDERLAALNRASKRPVGEMPSPFARVRNPRLRQEV